MQIALRNQQALLPLIKRSPPKIVHQLPFFALKNNRAGHPPEFIVRKLSHELNLVHLAALAEADMIGRHYHDKQSVLDDIELFRELASIEGCYGSPYRFADEFTRLRYCAGERIDPQPSYFREPGSEVIVMSGLPASGKDYWVSTHASKLPVVSFDDAPSRSNVHWRAEINIW